MSHSPLIDSRVIASLARLPFFRLLMSCVCILHSAPFTFFVSDGARTKMLNDFLRRLAPHLRVPVLRRPMSEQHHAASIHVGVNLLLRIVPLRQDPLDLDAAAQMANQKTATKQESKCVLAPKEDGPKQDAQQKRYLDEGLQWICKSRSRCAQTAVGHLHKGISESFWSLCPVPVSLPPAVPYPPLALDDPHRKPHKKRYQGLQPSVKGKKLLIQKGHASFAQDHLERALFVFQSAASLDTSENPAEAWADLGCSLLDGIGTAKDPALALHWLEKAANLGHSVAALRSKEAFALFANGRTFRKPLPATVAHFLSPLPSVPGPSSKTLLLDKQRHRLAKQGTAPLFALPIMSTGPAAKSKFRTARERLQQQAFATTEAKIAEAKTTEAKTAQAKTNESKTVDPKRVDCKRNMARAGELKKGDGLKLDKSLIQKLHHDRQLEQEDRAKRLRELIEQHTSRSTEVKSVCPVIKHKKNFGIELFKSSSNSHRLEHCPSLKKRLAKHAILASVSSSDLVRPTTVTHPSQAPKSIPLRARRLQIQVRTHLRSKADVFRSQSSTSPSRQGPSRQARSRQARSHQARSRQARSLPFKLSWDAFRKRSLDFETKRLPMNPRVVPELKDQKPDELMHRDSASGLLHKPSDPSQRAPWRKTSFAQVLKRHTALSSQPQSPSQKQERTDPPKVVGRATDLPPFALRWALMRLVCEIRRRRTEKKLHLEGRQSEIKSHPSKLLPSPAYSTFPRRDWVAVVKAGLSAST